MSKEVRVRFAPSPTGALHIGGVRTALYNYLFARKNGGKFILRIEDTDSQRFVEGAEKYVIEALKWCGIEIDEGVSVGGPHAPYRQSERSAMYLAYAKQLVENDYAYYAFDTAEELKTVRSEYEKRGETFSYNAKVRETLATSLSLPAEEVERRLTEENHWVVRFKMPVNEDIHMTDIIRGDVTVNSSTLDDKVLFKAVDKLPTYHLANIVDDYLMEISHVIRGEEWLPSLPLHVMLYRAFGWTESMPQFAHLPLLLKPSGKGKLSKRDGDSLGFPVFPLLWNAPDGSVSRGYREDGYLPEAFINMIALLGWNPGTEQEILSMDELIDLFSLEKVGKSGSRFDPEKAKWFNAHYIKETPNEVLAKEFSKVLDDKKIECEDAKLLKITAIVKERALLMTDFWELASYFFIAPTSYNEKVFKKFYKDENPARVVEASKIISEVEDFTGENIHEALHQWIMANEYPMGKIMNTLRLAIVGTNAGADLCQIMSIIGKKDTLDRINAIGQCTKL
ncbi:MAG: glutamate--tRNA ligase [Bacteroidetes bacterium]|nr:glutamate--tRNA ligase [Bacteroidota bacterium]